MNKIKIPWIINGINKAIELRNSGHDIPARKKYDEVFKDLKELDALFSEAFTGSNLQKKISIITQNFKAFEEAGYPLDYDINSLVEELQKVENTCKMLSHILNTVD